MYFFQNFQRQFLDGLHNPLIRPAISWEGWHWGGVGPLRFPWFNGDIPIYYKSLTWMFRPFWEGIPLLFKHQMWGGVIWTTEKKHAIGAPPQEVYPGRISGMIHPPSCNPSTTYIPLRTTTYSMILPTYPGKIPQTSPKPPQRKKFLHKLLVKRPGYLPGGPVGEILDLYSLPSGGFIRVFPKIVVPQIINSN